VNKLPRYAVCAVIAALPVVVLWRSVASVASLAVQNQEYTHLLLVIPISAAFLWLQWKSVKPKRQTSPAGLVLLAVAVAIWILSVGMRVAVDVQLALRMFALVTWWIGAFVLCYGARTLRLFLFPLCFLFWLVPFPQLVLGKAITALQQGSAACAHGLFSSVGVPVLQDGVVLSIPGLTLEIAKECSSIRSSLTLLLTSMVLGHLYLRAVWRQAVIFLIAVPLSVLKNGVRIFTLAMLGTRVDPGFLTGKLHHGGGIVFFSLALAILLLFLRLLQRGEKHPSPEDATLRLSTS